MDYSKVILNASQAALIELVIIAGLVIAFGLFLSLVENKANEFITRAIGRLGILITALIGTPVHEIGHLLMCIIFRHRINSVKLLNISKNSSSLGSVNHSFDSKNPYQRIGNFFIGLGPVFSAVTAVIILMWILLPGTFAEFSQVVVSNNILLLNNGWTVDVIYSFNTLIKSLFSAENLHSWNFWVFMFIALSISAHTSLSKSDINNMYDGIVFLFLVLFAINLIAALLSVDTLKYVLILGRYNYYLISGLLLITMLAIINFIVFFSVYSIKKLIVSEE